MFVTINWPNRHTLPVPEYLFSLLEKQLIEGFPDVEEARRYWEYIPTVLIVLDKSDDQESINQHCNDSETDTLKRQVAFALTYPEYAVPLGEDYQLILSIFGDEGAGIYLLIHNQCALLEGLANA